MCFFLEERLCSSWSVPDISRLRDFRAGRNSRKIKSTIPKPLNPKLTPETHECAGGTFGLPLVDVYGDMQQRPVMRPVVHQNGLLADLVHAE